MKKHTDTAAIYGDLRERFKEYFEYLFTSMTE